MVKMVPYEAFACPCGSEDVVLRELYKPKTCEERVRLLVGSPGASTTPIHSPGSSSTPIYSPGASTTPIYSPGSSSTLIYSPGALRNAECSNCKHLLDKITVLEAMLEMYKNPEQHTLNSAALLHEERGSLLVGSPGASTTPIHSPGSSSTQFILSRRFNDSNLFPGYHRLLIYSPERFKEMQTCSNCKHVTDKRIQVKDVVKELEDYLKTYSSVGIDISWFLVYLDGLEPYLLKILENGPYVPKSPASTPEFFLFKPQKQQSLEDRKLMNQDKRLKSIIISCLPNDIMKSVIKCTTVKFMWNDLILRHEGPSKTIDTKIETLRLKFNAFKALEGEKMQQTYTRLKILFNDLETKDVKIPQAEDVGITTVRAFMAITEDEPTAEDSLTENSPECASEDESVNDNQEPLPALPKLSWAKPIGTSKGVSSTIDLTQTSTVAEKTKHVTKKES
ncbi:hypothetical protein Tco_0437850 [Tanacetum coccineum]